MDTKEIHSKIEKLKDELDQLRSQLRYYNENNYGERELLAEIDNDGDLVFHLDYISLDKVKPFVEWLKLVIEP